MLHIEGKGIYCISLIVVRDEFVVGTLFEFESVCKIFWFFSLSLSQSHTHTHTHSFILYLSIYLSVYLSISIYISICLSIYLSISLNITHTHTHIFTGYIYLSLSHTHTYSLFHTHTHIHYFTHTYILLFLTHTHKFTISLSHTHYSLLSISLSIYLKVSTNTHTLTHTHNHTHTHTHFSPLSHTHIHISFSISLTHTHIHYNFLSLKVFSLTQLTKQNEYTHTHKQTNKYRLTTETRNFSPSGPWWNRCFVTCWTSNPFQSHDTWDQFIHQGCTCGVWCDREHFWFGVSSCGADKVLGITYVVRFIISPTRIYTLKDYEISSNITQTLTPTLTGYESIVVWFNDQSYIADDLRRIFTISLRAAHVSTRSLGARQIWRNIWTEQGRSTCVPTCPSRSGSQKSINWNGFTS